MMSAMQKVMVVDDDARMREELYDALTAKGYGVVTVGSGEQTIEMLKAQRPQLAAVNLTLPKLSGLEVIRKIREFDERIPVILTKTAAESAPPAEVLKELNILAVLAKEEPARIVALADATLAKVKAAPAPAKTGLSGTLLVIDDDAQVQQLLKMYFEKKGMRVITAGSGEEALQAVAKNPVLAMLDVNMPGMDGVLTLRKLKAAKPDLQVVMMSGGGEKEMAHAALKLGAYDYVSKPFNLEYLETVVLTKILVGLEA
jgi:DNA-binding response OmpR family regulator